LYSSYNLIELISRTRAFDTSSVIVSRENKWKRWKISFRRWHYKNL